MALRVDVAILVGTLMRLPSGSSSFLERLGIVVSRLGVYFELCSQNVFSFVQSKQQTADGGSFV